MDNPTTEALPALPVVGDPPTGWSCSGGQTFLATPGTTIPFTHHTEELWAQENIPKAALALPSRASAALASTTLSGGSVSFGRSPTLEGQNLPVPAGRSQLEAPLHLVGDHGGDGEGGGGGGRRGVPDVQDPAPNAPSASVEHKVIHQIPVAVQSLSSHARGTPAKARRSSPAEGKRYPKSGNQFP